MRQRAALGIAVLLVSTSIVSAVEIVDQRNATAPTTSVQVFEFKLDWPGIRSESYRDQLH